MRERGEITGHYFPSCQWCENDGNCVLLHHEFLGLPSSNEPDKSPYPGHENVSWALSGFQGNSQRGICAGRIYASDSFYYPLVCRCGTAISSLTFSAVMNTGICYKFRPNEKGLQRKELARQLAKRRHQRIDQILHLLPEGDPNYQAVLGY